MSNISFMEKLLDGIEVEWLALGGLAENLDSMRKPITSGLRESGEIPYYGASGIVDYVKDYIFDGDFLLVSEDGANLLARNTPIAFSISGKSWVNNHAHILKFNTYVERRFVDIYLNSIDLTPYISGAAQPKLNQKNLNSIPIPIPCPDNPKKSLEIQAEIVRILDAFTAMTAELTAELNLRKKQYNYYRDQLLSFEEGEVEWKTLGEVAENLDSKRKPIKSGLREAGNIPYYGASGIVDYVKDYIFEGDFLLVSEDGANLLARNTPIAFSISGKTWVNNHAHVLKFDTYEERRYVEYYLNSIDLTPYISGAAQPKLNKKNLESIRIPTPSPTEKERVVLVLDKFDALTNSITEGLPREIELRQKQYEYYRDLLLSFPKPNTEEAA
ncbi:restriction endonuclease subunit S [Amphritea pacifica]|uniref:restriction endonuclease subunit S n=1 Tax=Amphritea pacifica TaxID=2811233 RepID=UPI0019638B54|nr:restriction endonuclease subunit S [Amphritea pacifica]MBN1005453.1 restriction endonuclease subunit S [Amphritea pacifica]